MLSLDTLSATEAAGTDTQAARALATLLERQGAAGERTFLDAADTLQAPTRARRSRWLAEILAPAAAARADRAGKGAA